LFIDVLVAATSRDLAPAAFVVVVIVVVKGVSDVGVGIDSLLDFCFFDLSTVRDVDFFEAVERSFFGKLGSAISFLELFELEDLADPSERDLGGDSAVLSPADCFLRIRPTFSSGTLTLDFASGVVVVAFVSRG